VQSSQRLALQVDDSTCQGRVIDRGVQCKVHLLQSSVVPGESETVGLDDDLAEFSWIERIDMNGDGGQRNVFWGQREGEAALLIRDGADRNRLLLAGGEAVILHNPFARRSPGACCRWAAGYSSAR
jgi:hypothetical protein